MFSSVEVGYNLRGARRCRRVVARDKSSQAKFMIYQFYSVNMTKVKHLCLPSDQSQSRRWDGRFMGSQPQLTLPWLTLTGQRAVHVHTIPEDAACSQ